MKGKALFLVVAVLTGCKTHFNRSEVNTPSVRTIHQCSQDRYGDTDCIEKVDSQVDAYGVGAGLPLGVRGGLVYPSAPPPVIMAPVPVVPDGHRAMERLSTGGVQLVPVPMTELVTKKQAGAIVRKVDELDERVGDLEKK